MENEFLGKLQFDAIIELIEKENDKLDQKGHGTPVEKLHNIINRHKRRTEYAEAERKEVIDLALAEFTAFAMLAESVGMAETHKEKDARLRGMIDLFNKTIDRLRKEQVNYMRSYSHFARWNWGSTYPLREMIHTNDELTAENARLRQRIENMEEGKEIDDNPF